MKFVSSMTGGLAAAALTLCAAPALAQSYDQSYAYGYAQAQEQMAYGQTGRPVPYPTYYGQVRPYEGAYRQDGRYDRYAPPPAPYTGYQPYGVNSGQTTGYSYGYGGVGTPYASTQSYSYGYGRSYPPRGHAPQGYYEQDRYDRGGRYGYSYGGRYEDSYAYDQRRPVQPRPLPVQEDRWVRYEPRPSQRPDYGYQYDYGYRYGYDRNCWCQDAYIYGR